MGESKSGTNCEAGIRSPLLVNGSSGQEKQDYGASLDTTAESRNSTVTVLPLPSSTVIEPPNQYRSRWLSIRIMYFTMFMSAVTFTMSMSTMWPYLEVLDTKATPKLLGWVVASYSIGQFVASPLFGFWSSCRGAKEPLLVSLVLQIGSNVFYAYIQSVQGDGETWLIVARVTIGFSSGNAAVVRAYVSGATTLAERTGAMTMVSLFQSVGFILGPVFQTGLVALGYPGPVEKSWFHFNMYTSPGFLAGVFSIINLILLVVIFRIHTVDDTGSLMINVRDDDNEILEDDTEALVKTRDRDGGPPDYIIVFVVMYLFFVVFFMFTIFETIGTPLTMDMYGWSKSTAALYMGIILAAAGFVAIGVFIIIKILAKKGVSERKMLVAGYIFCMVGFITYLPWGNVLPVRGFAPIYPPALPPVHNSTAAPYLHWQDDAPQVSVWGADELKKNILTVAQAFMDYQRQNQSAGFQEKENAVNTLFYNVLMQNQNDKNLNDGNLQSADSDVMVELQTIAIPFSLQTSGTSPSEYTTKLEHNQSSPTTEHTITHTETTTMFATTTVFNNTDNSTVRPQGCPWEFGWCGQVPQVRLFQFILGTFFIAIGYPICNAQTYSLFSKVLGPQPQGLWMGILTACGSLARTLGPIFVAQVYDTWGPRVTFASSGAILLVTIVITVVCFHRLLPYADTPYRKKGSSAASKESAGGGVMGCCGGLRGHIQEEIRNRRSSVRSDSGALQ